MARGWESKSVEAQIEASDLGNEKRAGGRLTAEQEQLSRHRDGLLLSRSRVLQDLKTARNPRYRKILEAGLQHLEQQIAELDGRMGNPGGIPSNRTQP